VSNLDHIRSYYRALNTGDPELVASHFTDDAVHYYTRLGPHEGARASGENTKWAVENLGGQWHLEHGIEQGDEAVIEWTMTWRDPKSGEKRLNRGTEWFRLRDGKIAEVRAYHHGDRKNPRRATCSATTTPAADTRCSQTGDHPPAVDAGASEQDDRWCECERAGAEHASGI
jgi:ketosteroid isomerase-like protein